MHPEKYVRMLFKDTIIPDILVNKLSALNFPATCAWIKDFLTNRPQVVQIGRHSSSTFLLSTGSPTHPTNIIIKLADDTTLGLITRGDKSAYRGKMKRLEELCLTNNLSLNTKKRRK